jgi:hypothetical protein
VSLLRSDQLSSLQTFQTVAPTANCCNRCHDSKVFFSIYLFQQAVHQTAQQDNRSSNGNSNKIVQMLPPVMSSHERGLALCLLELSDSTA